MRITIVLGPFQPLPPVGYGAVEKVWYELAQVFARMGHEVVLVGKGRSTGDRSQYAGAVRVVPLRGYSAKRRLWQNLLKDLLYSFEVSRQIEQSDVIVTNTFWTPIVLTLAGRPRGKLIVHVARFPKGQMWLYRGADALQAISSAVAEEIVRQCPGVREKVHVLSYPVDLNTYRPPVVPRRYDGDVVVLYAGRIHPEKGVDLLIAAIRLLLPKVPRVRLRIVGPVDEEHGGGGASYFRDLKLEAASMPVEFAGPISEPVNLALEYQHAHCFCYPSIADTGEALGLSVLEAMATGLPVVVSDLDCFKDFLTPGSEGLVFDHHEPVPALALAKLLEQTLCDSSLAAQLGRNAAQKAQEFELDRMARRYLKFFENLA